MSDTFLQKRGKKKAFTFVELLVVMGIMSILAALSIFYLKNLQQKARDTRRLQDMRDIQTALEDYKTSNGHYPYSINVDPTADNDCGGYDIGYNNSSDTFISALATDGEMTTVPGDPLSRGSFCTGTPGTTSEYAYYYYRYTSSEAAITHCDPAKGSFYVLGIRNMESPVPPKSPGFSCTDGTGTNNWGTDFQWVTGKYE